MKSVACWPVGRVCAVTLAYDDGLRGHAREVAPALADLGLTASFFAPLESDLLTNHRWWRRLSELGHEIGNHTVFHPCRKQSTDDREWVDPCFDLAGYSESRLRRELQVANEVLSAIDGRTERTFGCTCFETTFGPTDSPVSMTPLLRTLFVAARGAFRDLPAIPDSSLDLHDVGTVCIDGWTFDRLRDEVDTARRMGAWSVLTAHGVGPDDHGLYVDAGVHRQFIRWLSLQQDVWVASFIRAARQCSASSTSRV